MADQGNAGSAGSGAQSAVGRRDDAWWTTVAGRLVVQPGRQAQDYLGRRFPPFQSGAILLSYICSYVLYGRVLGHQVFGWATVAGALSVVLLFLQRRIIDDLDDLRGDLDAKGLRWEEEGVPRRNALLVGVSTVVAAILVLNVPAGRRLLIASAALVVWVPLATFVIKKKISKNLLFRAAVNESIPAAILLYGYLAWREAAGVSIPLGPVLGIVGTFWTTYEFWNFSRKVGEPGYRPWGLETVGLRRLLLGLLAASAICAVGIYTIAGLPTAYLIYGVVLPAGFAAWVLVVWPEPAASPDNGPSAASRPTWAGLAYPATMELGIVTALILAALGGACP